ncbi:MAG: ATP-binding protein [Candidatus Neomarinimicrobiota bacterium]
MKENIQSKLRTFEALLRSYDRDSLVGRIAVTVICYIIYSLLFFPLYTYIGVAIGIFMALPIIVSAWLLGLWRGLISAIFSLPLAILLYYLVGVNGFELLEYQGSVVVPAMMLTNLLIVIVIGHMRDLENLIRAELDERKRIQEQLAEQAKQLQLSNTDLEQFAYVASHDLQEPLRAVVLYLQLIENRYKEKLDSDAQEFIDFAVSGAQRMQGLIKDLLAYSRVGRQGKPLEKSDTSTILKTVLDNLKLPIEETKAVITYESLPQIPVDPTQFYQLLQNLITNAMKFTKDKSPEIHVSAVKQAKEWLFSVKDNGIGIDQKHADRIFLIFQRLHPKSEYSGTGIGLAICKRIVERHGGRIWIESEPDKGSTFYFTIADKGADV